MTFNRNVSLIEKCKISDHDLKRAVESPIFSRFSKTVKTTIMSEKKTFELWEKIHNQVGCPRR